MRVAAGILLTIFGPLSAYIVAFATPAIPSNWTWAGLALVGLVAGGGVCALVKRAYWWAFSGAVSLLVAGIVFVVFYLSGGYYAINGQIDRVTQAMRIGLAASSFTLPGIMALVFLIKRKRDFQIP